MTSGRAGPAAAPGRGARSSPALPLTRDLSARLTSRQLPPLCGLTGNHLSDAPTKLRAASRLLVSCGEDSPDARTFEDQVRAYSLGGSPTFKLPFSLLWTPTGVKTGCVCRAPGNACHLGHGVQSWQGPGGGWTVGRWPPPPLPPGRRPQLRVLPLRSQLGRPRSGPG